MSGEPIRQRLLWWLQLRLQRAATWARVRWLRGHETGGIVLPPPYEKPRVRRSWFVVQQDMSVKCDACTQPLQPADGSIDSLPGACPACGYAGRDV